ncbi:hypothetical protein TWF696_004620 [Orbilia brochopaga]|uniref:RNA-dependent RNA polymerase n=1 Tax=Orbilia brochopaga TaxID=3140254 RepID=A0AAV9V6T7_9PEZI
MEFFVTDIPAAASKRQIRAAFTETFRKYFIYAFEFQSWNGKGRRPNQQARIIIHDFSVGQEILRKHGTPPPRVMTRGGRQFTQRGVPQSPILIAGSVIVILKSNTSDQISEHIIRALRDENDRKAQALANREPAQRKPYRQVVPFTELECGVWTTDPRNATLPTFSSFYFNPSPGTFRLTKQAIQVEISNGYYDVHKRSKYMLCPAHAIRTTIITREGMSAYFTVSMLWCPKFYDKTFELNALSLRPRVIKSRVPFLDDDHRKIAPYCFVYRFRLRNAHDAIRLVTIGAIPGFTEITEAKVFYQQPLYDFERSMAGLNDQLRLLPFGVAFQLQGLAFNGILLPHRVKELLTVVRQSLVKHGEEVTAAVLKHWVEDFRPQLDSDDPKGWLTESIISDFTDTLKNRHHAAEFMLQMKLYRKENQVLIHRVCITPAGIYLVGPALEAKNRVLRKYSGNLNHFVRVMVVEEDGGDLYFERGVDGKRLHEERFLPAFLPGSPLLRIGGRTFNFLGFSQSSLRTHAAWFMAPFQSRNSVDDWVDVTSVIRQLGDFGSIRIPGKCAARIGQAFTDTIANVRITPSMVARTPDITRTGGGKTYTFSDGCGTISIQLLDMIWKKGGYDLNRFQPTIFQIRFGGAKGVVSVDTRLPDCQLKIRNSMVKFDASQHTTFEICLSVIKPLPLYLNRHLVKILEDRGVPPHVFMTLQQDALTDLARLSLSADYAAYFLDSQGRCRQADVSFLLRILDELGFPYQEDKFLRQVVEFSMLNTLQDLKYRARIPIQKGFTLIGILDETGYLPANTIYCPIKREDEDRWVHTGRTAISRSPALHPGDVQVVTAIDVPKFSPLRALDNCVVFSQHGVRDLPNMLSGGDLDGDLYHVWWDPRIIPTIPAAPADYDTVKAQELDREVTQADIAKFFLDFMRNDRLGSISVAHMVNADQQNAGVFSEQCLKCAKLASAAVDFPKTGIPVEMSELPRTNNIRPDFLAPSPRVGLLSGGITLTPVDADDSDSDDEELSHTVSVVPSLANAADADDPFAPERQFLYYKSHKALGQLYREIDEFKFVKAWESTARLYEAHGPHHLLGKVRDYLLRLVPNTEAIVPWLEFAKHMRIRYVILSGCVSAFRLHMCLMG